MKNSLDYIKQEEFMNYYERVKTKLSGFARAMTRNTETAKDLVSDTILVAYENFDKINNKQAFTSYIFTIAVRLHRKRKSKWRWLLEHDGTHEDKLISHEPMPDISYDIQALYDALDELPDKMKESVILFEISGFSLEEIREIQGGTISGVKSRLKRGREKLREILNDSFSKHDVNNKSIHNNGFASNGSSSILSLYSTLFGASSLSI